MGIMGYDSQPTFTYGNKQLAYNPVPFQNLSERAVEVPIVIDFLKQTGKDKRILEVGNVLSNYAPLLKNAGIGTIDVLDKFEQGSGIMNVDLMDFDTPYDVIVSISTVEHIGQKAYGESQSGDREAPLKAIRKIYQLLRPGGKALLTVPFGKLMDEGWLIQFSSEYLKLLVNKYGIPKDAITTTFLKKLDADTSTEVPKQVWVQCEERELENTYFQSPFPFANGIAVIQLAKTTEAGSPIMDYPEQLYYAPPVKIGNYYFTLFYKCYVYDLDGWFSVKQPGFVFYGPYVELEPQVYRLDVMIEVAGKGLFTLDVTSDFGRKILWKRQFNQTAHFQDLLYVPKAERHVEVRLYKHDAGSCALRVPRMFLARL